MNMRPQSASSLVNKLVYVISYCRGSKNRMAGSKLKSFFGIKLYHAALK